MALATLVVGPYRGGSNPAAGEYKKYSNRIACHPDSTTETDAVRTFWQTWDGYTFEIYDDGDDTYFGSLAPADYTMQATAGITYPGPSFNSTSHPAYDDVFTDAIVGTTTIRVEVPSPPATSSGSAPPTYRIESRLPDGTYLTDLPFRDLQFEVFLNSPRGFRFKVPMYEGLTKTLLEAGKHEAWIYRNDVLVRCGPMWDVTAGSSDADLNINGADLLDYFDVLRINDDVTYEAVDQFTIVSNISALVQGQTNADYGITGPSGTSGIVRTVAYRQHEGRYALEAITDLSEMESGFDFWVDPDRSFQIFYPRLERDLGLRLEYPYTIRKYSVNWAGKWMRNDILVKGPDNKFEIAVSTGSRSDYGLRQFTDSYTDAPTTNALTAYASHVRDLRQYPKASANLSVETNSIDIFDADVIRLGDMITVIIDDGYAQLDQKLRLVGFQVTVGKHGNEGLVLYFNDDREVV